jgi:hypothetical protein
VNLAVFWRHLQGIIFYKGARTMGDKGGKKNKDKSQKQSDEKQKQKDQGKADKQPKSGLLSPQKPSGK